MERTWTSGQRYGNRYSGRNACLPRRCDHLWRKTGYTTRRSDLFAMTYWKHYRGRQAK